MPTTLKHTLDWERKLGIVGRDVKMIQAGVEQNIVISQQNYAPRLESRGHAINAASTNLPRLGLSRQQGCLSPRRRCRPLRLYVLDIGNLIRQLLKSEKKSII